MPATHVVTFPTQEPVTVAQFTAHSRLTAGTEPDLLGLYLAAARERCEAHCNRYFASCEVETTYSLHEKCPVPVADILAISGAITTVQELASLDSYLNEYRKGSIISRELPLDDYSLHTYTVRYAVTVNPEQVPASVKTAILKIAADLYENRESTTSLAHKELAIDYKVLLAPYRKINAA